MEKQTIMLTKIANIIWYLLSIVMTILLLNTRIFEHTYGMPLANILRVPLPNYDTRAVSIVITIIMIGIMYFILFKINGKLYRLMKKFFLARAFLLPVCVFLTFMVLVSNGMILSHNADRSIATYMMTILLNIMINYICILIIMNSIIIQYILVKEVLFDVVKTKKEFVNEDLGIIISTYLNFVFTFAIAYFLMQFFSRWSAFYGIEETFNLFETLMNCVYFSFITISSTGFGDMYPLTWYAKMLVCVEVLSGVALLTFSFGIILNSLSFNKAVQRHNKKQPIISMQSTIVSKNLRTLHNKIGRKTETNINYVTFELNNDERMAIIVPDYEYNLMVEGDTGSLTFQGSNFIRFERLKIAVDFIEEEA